MSKCFSRLSGYGAVALAAIALTGCMHGSDGSMPMARAELRDAQAGAAGSATAQQTETGVKLRVGVRGLKAGTYAMHLHQTGKCDGPKFETAGAHWNPSNRKHGLSNPAGPHAGDLPNFTVGSDGQADVVANLPGALLESGATPVLDADGTALVIHEKADDNVTDPSGNSGARIICGVMQAGG